MTFDFDLIFMVMGQGFQQSLPHAFATCRFEVTRVNEQF